MFLLKGGLDLNLLDGYDGVRGDVDGLVNSTI